MACPFFIPTAPLPTGIAAEGSHAPRLPLGDPYAGRCQADPQVSFDPPEALLRQWCNRGYARGNCRRFPDDSPADAVRFSVTADDGHGSVQLVYILEQHHSPLEHGPLQYAFGKWNGTQPPEPLASQARAFVENYLGRLASLAQSPSSRDTPV